MDKQKEKTGTPDYGSSSGFSGDVPQSGMVQDGDKKRDTSSRPPTGNGTENGSNLQSSEADTTDENPNANR